MPGYVTLVSDSAAPCGVEAFARRLSANLKAPSWTEVLDRKTGVDWRSLDQGTTMVINLPVVAWKKRLAEPVAAATKARMAGHRVVVVLHEWDDLDWRRRASYMPLLLLADTILFSCPGVARAFGRSLVSRLSNPARGVVPIPPNVALPDVLKHGPQSDRIRRERDKGRLILGHFGSIYPRKRSTLVLDVAAALKARGEDPFVLFAGSFIRGRDEVERDFFAHARRLGLADDMMVTGFIAGEADLFGLLTLADVFVYSFAEGLSARRASVFACLTAGKPVVVNAPRDLGDFDHHPTYRMLLASGLLHLVPTEADIAAMAEAVRQARDARPVAPQIDVASAWAAAAAAVEDATTGRRPDRVPRGESVVAYDPAMPHPSLLAE